MDSARFTSLTPVFIGGCPRSGTTMAGVEFARRAHALVPPESHFKAALLTDLEARTSFTRAVQIVESTHNAFQWGFPYDWNEYLDAVSGEFEPQTFFAWIVLQYGQIYGESTDYAAWIDHTPENILYGHVLLGAFPESRMIHLVRNPKAVFSSVKPLEWGPNTAYWGALEWMHYVATGNALEEHYPSRISRVRFEDLLCDFARVRDETLETLGIATGVDGRDVESPDYVSAGFNHSLVGKQPDLSRIGSWRTALTEKETRLIDAMTFNLQVFFGYEPEPQHGSIPNSVVPYLAEELGKRAWNRLRSRVGRFREQTRLRRSRNHR